MMNSVNKIEDWLIRVCLSPKGFGEHPGGVTLKYASQTGSKQETIRDYVIDDRTDVKQLGNGIYCDATDEAEGSGPGTHKFTLYAFRHEQKEHFARRAFLIPVENQFEEPVEEATAKGLLSQIQRHYEAQQRIQATMFPTVMHAMSRSMDLMEQRSRHLETTHIEALTMLKDMVMDKDARKQEMFLTAKAENRKDLALAKIGEMMPAVLMHLLPPEFFKEGEEPPPNGTAPPPNGNPQPPAGPPPAPDKEG